MEVAVVSALMTNIVGKILTVLEKRYEQLIGLDVDIDYMKSELSMIAGDMEDHLSQKAHLSRVQSASFTLMRDLAFDIEDCLDRFLPCGACDCDCEGEPASIGNENQVDFVDEIQKLKKRLEGAHQQKTNYGVKGGQQQASAVDASGGLLVDDAYIFEDVPVGIEKPKQELLDLLKGERERLMVISIVGFGGSGKTALANEVYHCPQVHRDFGCRAWAVASKHKDDAEGLLTAILQQLLPSIPPAVLQTYQASKIRELFRKHLQIARTRCLIVIDDIEKRQWEAIKPIFSALKAILLVTTTVQSVANACSSDYGYVYSMRTLSTEDSKILLKNKVSFFQTSSPDSEDGSEAIVHTCLGHPLALLSVANHLLDEKQLTGEMCKELQLGLRMEENKNNNFTKLRQVLMNNYSSLPAGSSLKTCLLYTSLFPNDRPVSRKTLTRRWLAEGYIESQQLRSDLEAAEENFKELTDRNIILPIDTSNNGKAKTCKPHGIMHQFMLHRSMNSNFIATSFGAKNKSNYRHLVIENRSNGTASSTDHGTGPAVRSRGKLNKIRTSLKEMLVSTGSVNKMRHRSLTVFGSAGEDVYSYLTNCKLLRVLDLKDSNDFKDEHLQKIYELLHLKYLTLGSSVSRLPVKMKGLHCLETLDLRKTKIETLPMEIISLPHLAHLFGKIKLKKVSAKNRENISLQTLAGVVVDKNSGFPELMAHMKMLTKVKIWSEVTSTDCSYAMLSEAIHKFAQDGMSTAVGARSLSLHLNDSSKGLLNHHQGDNTNAASRNPGYLSSLKLQGGLGQFPQFVVSLRGLKELCLTYTNLTGADLLLGLRKLRHLVFLKLVEVHLAGLAIEAGDLPSLQRLCLVVQQPRFPTIQQGALSRLSSIQLLCKGLEDLCGIKMEWFKDIQEIALDSMVNQETIKLWENEAKKHPRRPRVCFLKRVVDPAETRPSVKYVASCQVDNNSYTDTCTTDHMAIDPEDLTLKHESAGKAKSELVTSGLDRLTLQKGSDQVQARNAAGSDVGETSLARYM